MHGQARGCWVLQEQNAALYVSCSCAVNGVPHISEHTTHGACLHRLWETGKSCGWVERLSKCGLKKAAKSGLLTPAISSHMVWTVCCLQRASDVSVTVSPQSWQDSKVGGVQSHFIQLTGIHPFKKGQAQEMGINHNLVLPPAPPHVSAVPRRAVIPQFHPRAGTTLAPRTAKAPGC